MPGRTVAAENRNIITSEGRSTGETGRARAITEHPRVPMPLHICLSNICSFASFIGLEIAFVPFEGQPHPFSAWMAHKPHLRDLCWARVLGEPLYVPNYSRLPL